jgi:hypothetical protein
VDSDGHAAVSADGDGHGAVSPDAETTPMAVILARRSASQDPAAPAPQNRPADPAEPPAAAQSSPPASTGQRMRGPFEPAKKIAAASPPRPADSPPVPRSPTSAAATPMSEATGSDVWTPTTPKLDQIKDLYLTAEAIGEEALDRHFQQVSERQRQLIKEYFDQAVPSGADGGDTAP